MSHLCRELFPTLLEVEGLLSKLLLDNFKESRHLYKDIIDTETYVSILRLRNSVQSVLFPPLIEMGQTNIISNTNNISIDVVFFQKTIAEIGNQLLEIYRNLMI